MKKSLLVPFVLLVVNFLVIAYGMLSGIPKITLAAMLPFFLLGITLIILTLKQKIKGLLKKFLLLTGFSAAGFLVSGILHNAIYAVFKNFFDKTAAGDEVVFFTIAILVCPLGFLVGAVGSIVLLFMQKKRNHSGLSQ